MARPRVGGLHHRYERAVVVDAGTKENEQDHFRSQWRSVLKKGLTEPTLLEMSGNRVNQELGPLGASPDKWPGRVAADKAANLAG